LRTLHRPPEGRKRQCGGQDWYVFEEDLYAASPRRISRRFGGASGARKFGGDSCGRTPRAT
jgi:hypothetical protein